MAKVIAIGILCLLVSVLEARIQEGKTNEASEARNEVSQEPLPSEQVEEGSLGLASNEPKAEPYKFEYAAPNHRSIVERMEEGDSDGAVRGMYRMEMGNGLYRVVDYIADHHGYRASIQSNEPGVGGGTDIALDAVEPPKNLEERDLADRAESAAVTRTEESMRRSTLVGVRRVARRRGRNRVRLLPENENQGGSQPRVNADVPLRAIAPQDRRQEGTAVVRRVVERRPATPRNDGSEADTITEGSRSGAREIDVRNRDGTREVDIITTDGRGGVREIDIITDDRSGVREIDVIGGGRRTGRAGLREIDIITNDRSGVREIDILRGGRRSGIREIDIIGGGRSGDREIDIIERRRTTTRTRDSNLLPSRAGVEEDTAGIGVESFKPMPYKFTYSAPNHKSFVERMEEGDADGTVRGFYTIEMGNGLYRYVDYIADKHGYRAAIRSNEPGLGTGVQGPPTDTTLEIEKPPKDLKDIDLADTDTSDVTPGRRREARNRADLIDDDDVRTDRGRDRTVNRRRGDGSDDRRGADTRDRAPNRRRGSVEEPRNRRNRDDNDNDRTGGARVITRR